MTPELFPIDQVKRPPLRYYGGKFRLAPWIIEHIPEHKCYVEVFGGAAGVLLRKQRSTTEIYNDLDSQVVNFFQVLRDSELGAELARLVELTPFSREEFELSYEATTNPVEAARRFVTRCYMGHGTCSIDPKDSNGFRSRDVQAGKSYAREWAGIPHALQDAAKRFMGVTIEHLDFRKLIPKFDDENTLLYVDPPYPMETRKAGGKGYVHEMATEDHKQLAWLLNNSKSKVILSTYPSDLYSELFADWKCLKKNVTANGQKGSVKREELLYLNF